MILSGAEIEKYCYCKGRRYVSGERLFLNASGASVKGLFRGETLIIDLHAEPVLRERNAYIRLTVDRRSRRIRLPKKGKRIFLSLPRGEHLFEIVKLNESESNALALRALETEGELIVYEEKKPLKIEFVGDSITTGFGVRAKKADEEYSTATQDVTLSYAYLTARALNADFQIVAASGWGLYKSKYAPHALPDFYDNVDLTRNTEKWDFSRFRPDVVVLALGTNDFSYLGDLSAEDKASELDALRDRFVRFTRRLLDQGAKVILLCGFSGAENQKGLPTLIGEVWRAVDSPDLYSLQVKDAHSLNDIAAGHPGKRTHRLASARLTRLIRSILK